MKTTQRVISAIQVTGAAAHAADIELKAITQELASQVQAAMMSNPHSLTNDSLFENWKTAARVSQLISQLELDLRNIFMLASHLSDENESGLQRVLPPSQDKLVLLTHTGTKVDKLKRPIGEKRAVKLSAASEKKRQFKGPNTPLPGNAKKVLAHLTGLLSSDEFRKVIQRNLAAPLDIPSGSIGASMKKLQETGHLISNAAGEFKLVI